MRQARGLWQILKKRGQGKEKIHIHSASQGALANSDKERTLFKRQAGEIKISEKEKCIIYAASQGKETILILLQRHISIKPTPGF